MQTDLIIAEFIKTKLLRGGLQVPDADESLIDTGILDSTAVLKLLLFVEERFGLTITDAEVTPSNFETVRRIAAFIEHKTKAGAE